MKKEELFETMEDINEKYIAEARQPEKKRKHSAWIRWSSLAACLCVCVIAAFAIHSFIPNSPISDETSDSQNKQKYATVEGDQNADNGSEKSNNELQTDKKLQERINELQGADSLGWIVIENKVYIQDLSMDGLEMKTEKYLGKASEFTGFYHSEDACDGKVYSLKDELDLIYIKLENGAFIILRLDNQGAATNEGTYYETENNK